MNEKTIYLQNAESPMGELFLTSDGTALTGLWMKGQKHAGFSGQYTYLEAPLAIFDETKRWLDRYFEGKQPDFSIPVKLSGSTFQEQVWEILQKIPYGKLTSYGQIARLIQAKTGSRVSAQAVGGAVGRNPVSILVPCHRVVGGDGSLTGYAGGLDKKEFLLQLEGIPVEQGRIKDYVPWSKGNRSDSGWGQWNPIWKPDE